MSVKIDGSGIITGLDADGISAQPVFPGQVLQVVSTTKTDAFSSTSTSEVDVTGLSSSITPSSTNSKILVFYDVSYAHSGDDRTHIVLYRDETAIANGTGGSVRNQTFMRGEMGGEFAAHKAAGTYLDSPSSTASLTYKIKMFTGDLTFYVNRRHANTDDGMVSTITLMEIAG